MAIWVAILSSTGSAKSLCSPTPTTASGGQITICHSRIVILTALTNSPERLTSKYTQGSPDGATAGTDLNFSSRVASTRSGILGVADYSSSTKRENIQFGTVFVSERSDVPSGVADVVSGIFDSVTTLKAEAQVITDCSETVVSALAGFVNLYFSNIKPV